MRVRILGAGIIGLACADELRRRGHQVVLVDPAPGRGASYAAAGMLSPSSELWHGEDAILSLGRRSLALWPAFAARIGVALHGGGTLLVGRDRGDLQQIERQASLLASHGLSTQLLDARAVAEAEPSVGGRVAGGVHLTDDHSVDPRDVMTRLLDRPTTTFAHPDVTVLATGSRLPAPFTGLVRGVRGEVVRARMADPPTRVVRGWVHGDPVYVVPRASGEVVIGATSEEHDGPPVPTVGGVARLLATARELLPALDRAELVEVLARDRPATPDNLPLVGPTHVEGVLLAAGHYRHGVLLAPLTAQLVADHLETGYVEQALDPRRFDTTGSDS